MSQWPNFQEYRNLDSRNIYKLDDGSSATERDDEDDEGDEPEQNEKSLQNWSAEVRRHATEPPKTVRCVIDQDFGDGFKGLGSGDFGATPPNPQHCLSRRETGREQTINSPPSASNIDSIRLKNHLEWKKQKEAEYVRKREAERLEEQRKKEEKLKEEKEKRRKEQEREEKIREWQEQKAREKEERKREELVLKALEQEIKGVTQTLDKEKLIHEWIRLKNKQKQLEAEKKAELVKKEEETRALRQSLAEISYRQWKERSKSRRIALPKNGYQIFGPKPVPVVKEDWNHDFIKGDVQEKSFSARTSKSTLSMVSLRGPNVSRTDLVVNQHSNGDLKKKSPSSCQLKLTRSKTSVNFDSTYKLDLRDLDGDEPQPNKDFGIHRNQSFHQPSLTELGKLLQDSTKKDSVNEDSDYLSKIIPNGFATKAKFLNLPLMETLPSKNKLDIYLRTSGSNGFLPVGEKPKKAKKKLQEEESLKNYIKGKGLSGVNSKLLIDLNEKLSVKPTSSAGNVSTARKKSDEGVEKRKKKAAKSSLAASDAGSNRRSRSYDKPGRKVAVAEPKHPNRSSSVMDPEQKLATKTREVEAKALKPKLRRKVVAFEGLDNVKSDTDGKSLKRKTKKATKSEALLLVDSPYNARKTKPKNKPKKKEEKDAANGPIWKEDGKD